jgi:hypothetical protein
MSKTKKKKEFPFKTLFVVIAIILILSWILIPSLKAAFEIF